MATFNGYKSVHTGKRVDDAVSKIPASNPAEGSVIVVKTDGSSEYSATSNFVTASALDKKLDKTGGIITGNLTINGALSANGDVNAAKNMTIAGDLTVNGTQKINEIENLNVKNQMIYTNSGATTEMVGNGGLGIKTDANSVYGVTYDKTSNSVRLGLGKSDKDGGFTFDENEGHPVAIRADSDTFTDGDLVKWDSDGNKLISGGQLIDNLVGTDGITIDKSESGEKVEISGKNFVEKQTRGITNNGYVYRIASDGVTQTVNIVNVDTEGNSFPVRDANGNLLGNSNMGSTEAYNDKVLTNKKYVDDNFVAKKTKAGAWLYGLIGQGEETTWHINSVPTNGDIPIYSGTSLVTGTPTQDQHAANKKYVDNNFVAKVDAVNIIYGSFGSLKMPTKPVDYSNAATNQSVPSRDVAGSLYIPDAAIGRSDYNFTAGQEAVNKKYVDDSIAAAALGGAADQTYSATSEKAQSGKAVAEALTSVITQDTGASTTLSMSQKAVTDQINDLWAAINYVAPTIATFARTPATASYKLPASFSLTKITHSETNIANIEGNLTLKRGSTVLKSDIAPVATSTDVTVSDTVTLTTAGVTYTLSGVDKKGKTISRSVSVSAYYTSYFGASEDTAVSDTLIKGLTDTNSSSLSGTRSVTITGTNKYVWFISTQKINSIKSGGFAVPYTEVNSAYSYNGTSYRCYKTDGKVLASTEANVFEIS